MVTRDFARLAALCTIRWMTHGYPVSAPVCHGVIESPLVWMGRSSPARRDDTAINGLFPYLREMADFSDLPGRRILGLPASREAGRHLQREEMDPENRKYPQNPLFSEGWGRFRHIAGTNWRWVQSVANSSQPEIPWYQGILQENVRTKRRALRWIARQIREFC
jgi:hypothetical protein